MNEVTSNTESEAAVPEVSDEIVSEALAQGWVEKERYKGNPEDWVDAEKFVKRGREILPILRKNNESLLRELSSTKQQLKEFKKTTDEFKKFQQEAHEKKVKEIETQLAQYKTAKAQAISDGDGARVNAIDEVMDELKEQKKTAKDAIVEAEAPVTPPRQAEIDADLQSWIDQNPWFGRDGKATRLANALGETLREDNPGLVGKAFLEELDRQLAEELPSRFGRKKQSNGSPVESGSGRGRSPSGKHSYENLPAEAKDACNRFLKQGIIKTRDEYVNLYDWE